MPDYAPNFTARYRLTYSVLSHQHTMLWRIQRAVGSVGLALMVDKVRQYLDAMAPVRFTDWTEVSAEYAPEDVDIFAPAALPGSIAGTAVIPANSKSQGALAISHVGRSSAGQKARMFLYGTDFSPENPNVITDDFRVFTAENGIIALGVAELNSGAPSIMASDNLPVLWYSYVNAKYNDYWVAQTRS